MKQALCFLHIKVDLHKMFSLVTTSTPDMEYYDIAG
jgi:hypothetical protein